MIQRFSLLVFLSLSLSAAESSDLPRVTGGGTVKEVLWVRLDKDADVLKSLMAIIAEHKIQDGAVLNAVGNLSACKFHGVNRTMTEITEPLEILNLAGMIAGAAAFSRHRFEQGAWRGGWPSRGGLPSGGAN